MNVFSRALSGLPWQTSLPFGEIVRILLVTMAAALLSIGCIVVPLEWTAFALVALSFAALLFVKPVLAVIALVIEIIVLQGQPYFSIDELWTPERLVPITNLAVDKISVTTVVLALLLASRILLDRATGLRTPLSRFPLRIPSILLLGLAVLSLAWTANMNHALVQLTNLFLAIGIFQLLITAVTDEGSHRRIMWWIVTAGVIQVALAYVLRGLNNSFDLEILRTGTGQLFWAIPGDTFNLPGMGYSQHDLALTTNFSCGIALGLFALETDRLRRGFLLLGFFFMFSGILLTMSRAGLFSGLIMIHFLVFALTPLRRRAIRNLAGFYVVGIAIFITQLHLIGETDTPRVASRSERSLDLRKEFWQQGFGHLESSDGLGLGIGGYSAVEQPCPHAHSVFFAYLFDLGIAGLALFSSMAVMFMKELPRAIRDQHGYFGVMRIAILGVVGCAFLHGSFDFNHNTLHVWLILGIGAATLRLASLSAFGNSVRQSAVA